MHEVLYRHGGGVVDHGGGSLVHGAGVITSSVTMAGEQQQPVVDMARCKPAAFQECSLLCKVGLMDKPLPLETIKPPNAAKSEIYVKMQLRSAWLLKAVTGYMNPNQGSIYRTTLIRDLRDIVERTCNGEIPCEDESAVAGENDDEEENDPMNQIDPGVAVETPTKTNRCKRKRGENSSKQPTRRHTAKNKIVVTELPLVPPEVDPNTEAHRKVRLYIVDRRQVYLHMQDVDWAVKYLYAQNLLKGVEHVPGDSAGPGN